MELSVEDDDAEGVVGCMVGAIVFSVVTSVCAYEKRGWRDSSGNM